MNISKQKSGVIFLFVILLIIASVGTFVAMSLRVDPVEESLKSDPVIYTLWVITDDDGNALSTVGNPEFPLVQSDKILYNAKENRSTRLL